MFTKKRVLVLMSSYNGEKYIEKQIRSVMGQSIAPQVTLRIRDDGSTDKTCKIIERLAEEYYGKIELIKGKNLGYNDSFFLLINEAGGYDYYSLCDQDDVWFSSKLEAAVQELDSQDDSMPLLYASTSYLSGDDLRPYGQTRRKRKPFTIYNTAIQNICPGHTQVLNNALLKIIQEENVNSDRVYVYDSWITSQAVLYGKIIFNNSSFAYYRQHKKNQLGYGAGKIGQLFASIKRNETGDGYKYRGQVEYLVEINRKELIKAKAYDEFRRFLRAKTFREKLMYAVSSKLYRQNKMETVVWHIGVLSGHY